MLRALWDIAIGLRPGAQKPIAKYRLELEQHSESRKLRLENLLDIDRVRLNETKEQALARGRRNLRRLEATRDAFAKTLEKKRIQLNRSHSLLVQSRKEFEVADADYKRWRGILGRPAFRTHYSSLFDQMRYSLNVSSASDGVAGKITTNLNLSPIVGSLSRRSAAILIFFLSIFVVPLDIFYSYQGFLTILEDPQYAWVAAILLGFVLASLGAALGSLFSLIYERRCVDGEVQLKPRFGFTLLFFVTFIIACSAVYAATTIRSIVPEANAAQNDLQNARNARTLLLRQPIEAANLADRASELRELASRTESLLKSVEELRLTVVPRFSADAVIAFCFYSFAIISLMIARILSRDPIPEYHLSAVSRDNAQRAMLFFENEVEEGFAQAESIISSMDAEIENAMAELDEVEGRSDIIERVAIKEKEIEALEREGVQTVKIESLKYAKAMRFLTRDKNAITEWEELYDEN